VQKLSQRRTGTPRRAPGGYFAALYTVSPAFIVSSTLISLIVAGGTVSGFLSRMTKSPSLPVSMLPLLASSKC